MDFYTALAITLIAMLFSAFFSGMEIAFITSNRVRVELDVKKEGFVNKLINIFYRNSDMFISTMLVGNNIMLVIYGMGVAVLLDPLLQRITTNSAFILLAQTVISTGVILITGEFLPKTIFRINPNLSLRHFAPMLYVVYLVLYPISWFSSFLSRSLMMLFGAKAGTPRSGLLTVGELDEYIQQAMEEKDGNANNEDIEHEVKIFQNALDFSSTYLRDCMIPRNEIVAVDIDKIDRDSLCHRFSATGLSKIIVYKGDIDNVAGYIHVNELFHSDIDWKTRIKPVEFAPESMPANTMMRKMLSEKKNIAIVVDEFGGTGGLVTLEDLVEEIFGDFEDEHDRRHLVSEQIDKNTYQFSGRMEIEDLNDEYGFKLPENDEYQTLAGYIIFTLGALPQQGESFNIDGLRFTILKKSATRIELVRIERLPAQKEA